MAMFYFRALSTLIFQPENSPQLHVSISPLVFRAGADLHNFCAGIRLNNEQTNKQKCPEKASKAENGDFKIESVSPRGSLRND